MHHTLVRGAAIALVALPLSAFARPQAAQEAPSAAARMDVEADAPGSFKLSALQFGAGAAAAIVSVPASVALGVWLGSLSTNLVLAALPAIAAFVVLPPLAITFAAVWIGNLLSPGSSRLRPAIWTTMVTQLLVLVGAIALGVHGQNFTDVALLTLLEAVVLPGVAVGTMRLFPPAPPAQSPLQSRAPLSDNARPTSVRVLSVPVASWTL